MEGMTGGTLIIHGNAGARLGDRMRRGLVLVGGDAGDFAASRLVAGTIGIAGRVGAHYRLWHAARHTVADARSPGACRRPSPKAATASMCSGRLLVRSLAREIAPFSRARTPACCRAVLPATSRWTDAGNC